MKCLGVLYNSLHKVSVLHLDLISLVDKRGDDSGKWDILCFRLGVERGTIAEIREDFQAEKKLYSCLEVFVDLGEPYSYWEKVVSAVCGPPLLSSRGDLGKL